MYVEERRPARARFGAPHSWGRAVALLGAATVLLGGCGDSEPTRDTCVLGTEDCPCLTGDIPCRSDDLFCAGGYCRLVGCSPGSLDCGCYPNLTCDKQEDGSWLVCSEGLCREASCVQGKEGCGCFAGATCSHGLVCSEESGTPRCITFDCTQGTLGCGCESDGSCSGETEGGQSLVCSGGLCTAPTCEPGGEHCECGDDQSCDAGLVCSNAGKCIDAECTPGALGCECEGEGACSEGLDCSESGFCVAADCTQGSRGCGCLPDETCGSSEDGEHLACMGALCRDCRYDDCGTLGVEPPDEPRCYTPCRVGFTDQEGVYHDCPADGLMVHEPGEPCLDDKLCVEGSCIEEGDPTPTCAGDIDCPDFQNCVRGKCYALCDTAEECLEGRGCYQHSCRAPCSSDDQTCPATTACQIVDAANGYCMPIGEAPRGAPEGVVLGTFSISDESIEFTNSHVNDGFSVTNDALIAVTFTIAKLEHREGVNGEPVTENPMPWLSMGEPGDEALANEMELTVDAGETRTVSLADAATEELDRWQGLLEVRADDVRLGTRQVRLSYASNADGRWAGTFYYFANFGTLNLNDWLADKESFAKLQVVGNALVRRWGDFRSELVTWENFEAAFQSVRNESWQWATVSSACDELGAQACYPYADADNPTGGGIEVLSTTLTDNPVPTGVAELPVAFDIAAEPGNPMELTGRIVTTGSLQYPGDPALELTLESDPASSDCDRPNGNDCVVPVLALSATSSIGGRYLIDSYGQEGACPRGWQPSNTPWLVPGFLSGTTVEPESLLLYRSECRDQTQPGGTGADTASLNASLAGGNPIPDGVTRVRRLELLDGALISQDAMLLLVREVFDSFLGAGDTYEFGAYGLIKLSRAVAQLEDDAFVGSVPPEPQAPPDSAKLRLECSNEILAELGVTGELSADNAREVALGLLDGFAAAIPSAYLDETQVHYLCHDTGKIDGGNTANNGGAAYECPAGSQVTYFYSSQLPDPSNPDIVPADLSGLPCQNTGTCQETLDSLRAEAAVAEDAPVYLCTGEDEVFCDGNRQNLKDGKVFYAPGPGVQAFLPLRAAINDAFRYKTQFQNRDGDSVGFAPGPCVPNSNAVPYCYDAAQIEEARARVDCALRVYRDFGGSLGGEDGDDAVRQKLRDFLGLDFAYEQNGNPPLFTYDGFEMMYAELLVMLGDDAYTSAFASRFDLAGAQMASFQGSLFEPGGIDLSGAAGYEMYLLYEATQYYQLVLERLYQVAPDITLADGQLDDSFITGATFTSYFPRLIRASAQKTRAQSEIAKRYQSFNRPELARRVLERGYSAAYIESVLISRLITRFIGQVTTEKDQMANELRNAALVYKSALLEMRTVYQDITDSVTYFGFAPDYIPFPALEPGDTNAFSKMLALAKQRLMTAAEKEQAALAADKSYETDAASFQSELVKLRINYESQLAEICGTFSGDDGALYPAIAKYAYLNENASALGDPCGLMGSGALYGATGGLDSVKLKLQSVLLQYDNVLREIEYERARVEDQCDLTVELADARYETAQETRSLQDDINQTQLIRSGLTKCLQALDVARQAVSCVSGPGGTDCVANAAAAGVYLGAFAVIAVADLAAEASVYAKQSEIADVQAAAVRWETLQGCESAKVDSECLIKTKALSLKTLDLDALQVDYELRLALAEIKKYRDQAQRVAAQMEEMQQQTIDIEAARNNPNVRIYKNDAVLNADRTFEHAARAVYQATKVYEYYTSQSYARASDLFLVRMVASGDLSLENYVAALEDAYLEFQQAYGNPDERVDILSLRDDILAIPRMGADGSALTQAARIALFRERLKDPQYIDENGYLTLPFVTSAARLSPVTMNHKVLKVEAEIVGSDVGDTLGRVYLRQKGTGIVQSLAGETLYYRFPETMAVVDTFFNGSKVLGPEIYASDRLRDLPFINSRWDLVLNQKDELANQDIDLNSVTDMRVYVYYTDFTGS